MERSSATSSATASEAQASFWEAIEPATAFEPATAPEPEIAPEPALAPAPQPSKSAAVVQLPQLQPSQSSINCPERLLLLDTETTGLQPPRHACIEVGAILFHVPSRAVLGQVSFLLPCRSNPAEAINGIAAEVSRLEQPWQPLMAAFEALVACADVVVAHNAAFDRQWFGHGPLAAIEKPWLCSMEDLRWPQELQLRPHPSLRDLALAHGVPVWAAHRALTDCIYLAQVFERCGDLEALLVAGLEPRRLYRAKVSYEQRQRAREAGFRWNDPVEGAWTRRLSEREVAALEFPVVPIDIELPGQRRSA